MSHPRGNPAFGRLGAIGLVAALLLGAGCFGHAGGVGFDGIDHSLLRESREVPLEIRAADVQLLVEGEQVDAPNLERSRSRVATELTGLLGPPAEGARRAATRLTVTSPRAPLIATGPYKWLRFALETELPSGRVVRSASHTATLDDAELFALEHWGLAAAATQGALALGLAGLGVGLAANDPTQAANAVLFSALPTAAAATVTAVLALAMREHAHTHQQRRAEAGLRAALTQHARDLRGELARDDAHPVDAARVPRPVSAVLLTLDDEVGCLSDLDLKRDLEALVPATSSARYALQVSVTAQAGDGLAVRLRLSSAGGATLLAEREMQVARPDCAALPRVIARIVRKNLEAAAGATEVPRGVDGGAR